MLWCTSTVHLNILRGRVEMGSFKKGSNEVPDWVIYGLVILSPVIGLYLLWKKRAGEKED